MTDAGRDRRRRFLASLGYPWGDRMKEIVVLHPEGRRFDSDALVESVLAEWKAILDAHGLLDCTKGASSLSDALPRPLNDPRES